MTLVRMCEAAQALPEAWSSRVLARFGDAQWKLLRMDAAAYPEESHGYTEGLFVIDGEMRLAVGDEAISVRAGELYVVPAGVVHSVAPGSYGTLVILDT
ncbi:MAG TPA: cupin domain-containing protein [Dyella sp.]|uniref:cupin domain-containing protein n=1 Tax=Dyella sp. TaxID=1869338 RepID=UPI002F93F6ED